MGLIDAWLQSHTSSCEHTNVSNSQYKVTWAARSAISAVGGCSNPAVWSVVVRSTAGKACVRVEHLCYPATC